MTSRSPSAPCPGGIIFLAVCRAPPACAGSRGCLFAGSSAFKDHPFPFPQPLLKCHLPTEATFRSVFLFKLQPPPIASDSWFFPCLQRFPPDPLSPSLLVGILFSLSYIPASTPPPHAETSPGREASVYDSIGSTYRRPGGTQATFVNSRTAL